MTTSRNDIMDALLSLLESNMPSIVTFTRKYKEFSNTSLSSEMPYLMLCKPREQYPARPIKSLPAKRSFTTEIIINISAGIDQNSIPDETVCDIMDELDLALRPTQGNQTQTLGGLVDHCYIEGDVICVPGDLDGLGMIHVPVTIMLP